MQDVLSIAYETVVFCTQLTRAYVAETSFIVVIYSAKYLLVISTADIDKVAMSLYDISIHAYLE